MGILDIFKIFGDKSKLEIGSKKASRDININKNKTKVESQIVNNINNNISINTERINNVPISLDDLKQIKTCKHYEDVQKFVRNGCVSTDNIASFVADYLSKVVNESNDSKRKEILDALLFIEDSSEREKSLLLWSYILSTIHLYDNIKIIKSNINIFRSKFPLVSNIFRVNEVPTFVKVGTPISNTIKIIILEDAKFNSFFPKESLKMIGIENKDQFLEIFSDFKNLDKTPSDGTLRINFLSLAIPNSLNIAAQALLKSCGIKFQEN